MPCEGGSNCCTRICADPGTGAKVCLPASGCRMTGLACLDDQACCGGGTNPNGSVECRRESEDDAYGRCDNGEACNPVGNICGATFTNPDGSTFSVNASQNCCDGRKEVCKLDSAGIPRCFGGGSEECPTGYTGEEPCCIEEGEVCQFKDQCCDGNPCVSDDQGVLRCTRSECVPSGSTCTPGGDPCCTGECEALGELQHVCDPPDQPMCKPNGDPCGAASECCSGICLDGKCAAETPCQGDGETCTSNGDCCGGLSCVIPAGSASGTCQEGEACGSTGQSCSSASPCCAGLECVQTQASAYCDDTTPCECIVILN